jgi:hypothetical protein
MKWDGFDNWLARGKLSKKFLMELPEIGYIVSNVGLTPDQRIFAEKVAPLSKREDQWRRIVSAGADQKLCMVFKNEKEYNIWTKNFMKEYSKRMT